MFDLPCAHIINLCLSLCVLCFFYAVEPPVLKYPPSDVTTALDGNVTLACHAQGYGPLTFTWEKKGIGIIHSSHSPLLEVVNASAVSAGLYRCSVTNLYGEKVVSLYFKLIGVSSMYICICLCDWSLNAEFSVVHVLNTHT